MFLCKDRKQCLTCANKSGSNNFNLLPRLKLHLGDFSLLERGDDVCDVSTLELSIPASTRPLMALDLTLTFCCKVQNCQKESLTLMDFVNVTRKESPKWKRLL